MDELLAAVLLCQEEESGNSNAHTRGWDEGRWRALQQAAMDGALSQFSISIDQIRPRAVPCM